MGTVRRRAFTIATLSSLLLAALTIHLWARSYRHVGPSEADSLNFTHSDPYWWAISDPGRLTFCHQVGKDWDSPTAKVQFLGLEYASSWVGKSCLVNLLVPYWMILAPLLILPAAQLRASVRDQRSRRRTRRGLCGHCGYDLRGSRDRCPECGALAATMSET
jgi:hypothetical protein